MTVTPAASDETVGADPPTMATPFPTAAPADVSDPGASTAGFDPLQTPRPSFRPAPATIGPYRIVGTLGEGGMGTVYRAEQDRPIRRSVAVKVIRAEFAHPHVIARFEAERQALARMDHPNVARVFDAGTDAATGVPYFVMELVDGVPVTQFCDANRLSVRDRLGLFLQVCDGIGHAHTKAVLHRDIKAGNVLASRLGGTGDGQPWAKVIDFGVAKAMTADRLSDRLSETVAGQTVGTYESMSPEQAAGSPDVDTRTDVFALGVLLYELLCGAKPFAGLMRAGQSNDQLHQVIRDVEPPRPSDRVTMIAQSPAAAAVADARQTTQVDLRRRLRSELEWIPLKAMRKDRDRRYASVADLADDVRNYLADRPLRAGPESLGYRARKAARRNRAAVATAAAVLIAAGAGLGRYLHDVRAERARTAAALREAEAQRDQARHQEAVAQAVSTFQTDMFQAADVGLALGTTVSVEQVMTSAVHRLDGGQLADQPLVAAAVRAMIGRTLASLGRRAEAERCLRSALSARRALLSPDDPLVAESEHDLGTLLQDAGQATEAEALLRGDLSIRRRTLPPDLTAVARAERSLAMLLRIQNRSAEAETLLRDALRTDLARVPVDARDTGPVLDELTVLLTAQNRLAEAEPFALRAVDLRRRTGPPRHPSLATALDDLGSLQMAQGKLSAAEASYREALAIRRAVLPAGDAEVAETANNLAGNLQAQGKFAAAEPLFQEALDDDRRIYPDGGPRVATGLSNLANLLRVVGRPAEAEPMLRDAIGMDRRAWPAGHPQTAIHLNNLGVLLQATTRPADAESAYRESIDIARNTGGAGHPNLASTLDHLGDLLCKQGRPDAAELPYREALTIRTACFGPTGDKTRATAAALADSLDAAHRPADAEAVRAAHGLAGPATARAAR